MVLPSVEELVLSERKFLHDIANDILVAHGMITLAQKVLADNKIIDQKEIEKLEKAIMAINKMTSSLKERRSYLHEISREFT